MSAEVQTLVLLLVALQLKHVVADFLFQTDWTIAGKERDRAWLAPLMAHAGGHAALTLLIMLAVAPAFFWLGAVDLLVHAAIDRGKGAAGRLLHANEGGRLWWRIFGFDQMLHHLTHLALAVVIVWH
jgi:hypothetical protein